MTVKTAPHNSVLLVQTLNFSRVVSVHYTPLILLVSLLTLYYYYTVAAATTPTPPPPTTTTTTTISTTTTVITPTIIVTSNIIIIIITIIIRYMGLVGDGVAWRVGGAPLVCCTGLPRHPVGLRCEAAGSAGDRG
ncbi:hypothetical protein E2C01_041168 [Portunus trituberculatus]|uniref:Uncharacterized protein n=1 Tax=Portunus trituberculatus TaxID=210409 RepID=A0A5B7FQZ0_PORTR|nr:hypothetical protein [Portunus trituberculatus]